ELGEQLPVYRPPLDMARLFNQPELGPTDDGLGLPRPTSYPVGAHPPSDPAPFRPYRRRRHGVAGQCERRAYRRLLAGRRSRSRVCPFRQAIR
ncbi:hypothetical protein BVW01_22055, partial [Mycobacterium tuberculosis]